MGFFAVFKKSKVSGNFEFVDRWLNTRSDDMWIERTILSLGWSPAEVIVAWYWAMPSMVIGGVDEDFNIFSYRKVLGEDEGGNPVEVLEVDETFEPTMWYQNGTRLKAYEE